MKKVFLLVLAVAMLCTGCSKKGGDIGQERAKEIALEHAGVTAQNVTFTRISKDRENKRIVYEVEFYSDDKKEYDYEIDAATGEVLSFDNDYDESSSSVGSDITEGNSAASSGEMLAEDITVAKAKEIALSKVSGATESDIREFEKERDDGKDKYEGKIYYGNNEYEFEIDARTGEIIKWETEAINN